VYSLSTLGKWHALEKLTASDDLKLIDADVTSQRREEKQISGCWEQASKRWPFGVVLVSRKEDNSWARRNM